MSTLRNILGDLPLARLAVVDLPHFLASAFGRLSVADMPRLRAALDEEPLVGYPPSLRPIMTAFSWILEARAEGVEGLEAAAVKQLLGAPGAIAIMREHVNLERLIVRPGEPLSPEIRHLVSDQVQVLPGFGPRLTLVAPVTVLQLPGLGLSILQSPAIARSMSAKEAEELHEAWAVIEESTAWPTPPAIEWESRYVRITSRPNYDINGVVSYLSSMQPSKRRMIWPICVDYLCNQELPEAHRPGLRGLKRQLDALELGPVAPESLTALLEMATGAYQACRERVTSRDGTYPCTSYDLDAFSNWVELPDTLRQHIRHVSPGRMQHWLRQLACIEAGVLQTSMDPEELRLCRTFRNQYLRARYGRDVSSLIGIDPLRLCQAHSERGEDRALIIRGVSELAEQARRAMHSRQLAERREDRPQTQPDLDAATAAEVEEKERGAAAETRDGGQASLKEVHGVTPPTTEQPPESQAAAMSSKAERTSPAEPPSGDRRLAEPVEVSSAQLSFDSATPFTSLVTAHPPTPRPQRPPSKPVRPFSNPFDGLEVVESESAEMTNLVLPPLPTPPPRTRTATKPNVGLPPLPPVPPPRQRRPRTRPRTRPLTAEALPPMPQPPLAKRPKAPPPPGGVSSSVVSRKTSPTQDFMVAARDEVPLAESSSDAVVDDADTPRAASALDASPSLMLDEERSSEPVQDVVSEAVTPSDDVHADVAAEVERARPRPSTSTKPVTGGFRLGNSTTSKSGRRLVTPAQATRFYEDAFRELQILERDLLERGPWVEARARVDALSEEAAIIADALGPAARSGDKDFRGALSRVEFVRSYLERVGKLLDHRPPVTDTPSAAQDVAGGVFDKLSGLFRRDE